MCSTEERIFEFDSVEEIIEQGKELFVIEECEFDIVYNDDGTMSLWDLQGANLADIESDRFDSLADIVRRLEGSYLHDYAIVENK